MAKSSVSALIIIWFALYGATANAQAIDSAGDSDEFIEAIIGAAIGQAEAYAFLRELTDSIGGRVTGSIESERTANLIKSKLRAFGFENTRFEEYELASRWRRGQAAGSIVSPISRQIVIGSYGWAPGIDGDITATVVDLGAPPGDELLVLPHQINGSIVVVEPDSVSARAALAQALSMAGARAMLIPSDKPGRMLYTSAFGLYPLAPLPVLSMAREDTLLIRRLLSDGPVEITVNVTNAIDEDPTRERNVVADIQGAIPDETVLIGAHFDSWDLGQGAIDNGSGVAAVLDAARILKSLGIVPRRTILFVFFSGEEQGLLGSRAYVARHANELDQLASVIIMDDGPQKPLGLWIHGRRDIKDGVHQLLTPLIPLRAGEVNPDSYFDTDHGPFMAVGVPSLTLWVEEDEYDIHHHAVSDTFDKVSPDQLSMDAAMMAVVAYKLATSPERLGARLNAEEISELLEEQGLEPMRRTLYEY